MSGSDIFISYCRADRPVAHVFAERLEEAGFSVWWDAALHSGETFDEVIERNLRAAKAVVVLWSPRSVVSRWVRAEATLADRNGSLAPVIIEPCDRPIIFELTHTAELSHWNGDASDFAWLQFVADLRELVGETSVAKSRLAAGQPAISDSALARHDNEPRFGGSPAAIPAMGNPAPSSAPDQAFDQTQLLNYDDDEPGEKHILEVLADSEVTTTYEVGPLGMRIGRCFPAEVVLNHPGVSRNHCALELTGGDLLVTDLDSTNGTFVDEERVTGTAALPVGSSLKVGGIVLVHKVQTPVTAP